MHHGGGSHGGPNSLIYVFPSSPHQHLTTRDTGADGGHNSQASPLHQRTCSKELKNNTNAGSHRRAIDGSRLIAPASQGKLQLRTVAARVP
jgi:hypothetical protein